MDQFNEYFVGLGADLARIMERKRQIESNSGTRDKVLEELGDRVEDALQSIQDPFIRCADRYWKLGKFDAKAGCPNPENLIASFHTTYLGIRKEVEEHFKYLSSGKKRRASLRTSTAKRARGTGSPRASPRSSRRASSPKATTTPKSKSKTKTKVKTVVKQSRSCVHGRAPQCEDTGVPSKRGDGYCCVKAPAKKATAAAKSVRPARSPIGTAKEQRLEKAIEADPGKGTWGMAAIRNAFMMLFSSPLQWVRDGIRALGWMKFASLLYRGGSAVLIGTTLVASGGGWFAILFAIFKVGALFGDYTDQLFDFIYRRTRWFDSDRKVMLSMKEALEDLKNNQSVHENVRNMAREHLRTVDKALAGDKKAYDLLEKKLFDNFAVALLNTMAILEESDEKNAAQKIEALKQKIAAISDIEGRRKWKNRLVFLTRGLISMWNLSNSIKLLPTWWSMESAAPTAANIDTGALVPYLPPSAAEQAQSIPSTIKAITDAPSVKAIADVVDAQSSVDLPEEMAARMMDMMSTDAYMKQLSNKEVKQFTNDLLAKVASWDDFRWYDILKFIHDFKGDRFGNEAEYYAPHEYASLAYDILKKHGGYFEKAGWFGKYLTSLTPTRIEQPYKFAAVFDDY